MPIVDTDRKNRKAHFDTQHTSFEGTQNGCNWRFRQSEHKLREAFANQNVLKYKRPDNRRLKPDEKYVL